jgi:hypothetical protein
VEKVETVDQIKWRHSNSRGSLCSRGAVRASL